MQHIAYLGLGSNLNNPKRQVHQAINRIGQHRDCTLLQVAPMYRSKAWGVTDQPDFYNTAISIQTRLSPLALLKTMKAIEYRVMGRVQTTRWQARVIDIDILLYDRLQMNRPELQIPHPWIHQRCFVVAPLMDLKPALPMSLAQLMTQHNSINRCQNSDELIKTP